MSDAAAFSPADERPLPLRARRDLEWTRTAFQGRPCFVAKDPCSLRYVRLSREEKFVLDQLDGATSLRAVKDRFERQFPERTTTTQELHRYVGQLFERGLASSLRGGQGSMLLARGGKQRRQKQASALFNPLCIRFPAFNPARVLAALAPCGRAAFDPRFLALVALLALVLSVCLAIRFDEIAAELELAPKRLAEGGWLGLLVAIGAMKVFHELGHGLACQQFGAQCRGIGVMLLFGAPCLYCDVTDAWTLPDKWRRAAVAAAGMYFEAIVACLAALIWLVAADPAVRGVALQVVAVGSVSTWLFNANPLVRFDGYYILADLSETPGLAARAQACLKYQISRWLGANGPDDAPPAERRRGWLIGYGAASLVYRGMIICGLSWLALHLGRTFGFEGLAFGLVALALSGVSAPFATSAYRWTQQGSRRANPRFQQRAGLLTAGAAIALFLPLPHHIACRVTVHPAEAEGVYVGEAGVIAETFARPGDRVAAGAPLVRLDSSEALRAEIEARAARDAQRIRVETFERMRSRDASAEEANVAEARERLNLLNVAYRSAAERRDDLLITAPNAGVVLPPSRRPAEPRGDVLPGWDGRPLDSQNRGAALAAGDLVCLIGDPTHCEALLAVDEHDLRLLAPGASVKVLLHASGGRVYRGVISSVGAGRNEESEEVGFEAAATLDTRGDALPVDAAGWAKVHVGYHSLAWRLRRTIANNFELRF